MIKQFTILIALAVMTTGCTITNYYRKAPDGEEVRVSNTSLGMTRKDINLSFDKKDEVSAKVVIGGSNGSDSFNKAADSLIEAGRLMKSVGGTP